MFRFLKVIALLLIITRNSCSDILFTAMSYNRIRINKMHMNNHQNINSTQINISEWQSILTTVSNA